MFRGRAHNQIILFYSDFDSHTQRATLKFKWIKWEPLRVLMNINGLVTQVISIANFDLFRFWTHMMVLTNVAKFSKSIPKMILWIILSVIVSVLRAQLHRKSSFISSHSISGEKKIQFIEKANLALVTFWWWLNGMFDVTNCCVMLSQRY